MNNIEELKRLLSSKRYLEVKTEVGHFEHKVETLARFQLSQFIEQTDQYFFKLQSNEPQLYSIFEINHKQITQIVRYRLNGKRVILD